MTNLRPTHLPVEILDNLAPDTAEARASRRDLRIFNRLLANERWIKSVIRHRLREHERVLELGAGEGALARDITSAGGRCDALDLLPPPSDWPTHSRWIQGEVLSSEWGDDNAIVVANLFLHHFNDSQLAVLGERLRSHARVIAIADLHRSRVHEGIFGVVARVIRAHAVSRHDGRLSIRAGFRGDELPRSLGLDPREWSWEISRTLFGAYRLLARKRP